jgi:two-component system cell cycle response regulator
MGLFSKRTKFDKASAEKGLGITRKYNLAGGKSYVVEESPPDISFDAFVNIISTSSRDQPAKVVGLAISRQHPDLIRQKYGLEETPIYWLATRTGQDVISPTNLGILTHTMIQFIEENASGVILLDGLEYLVSNNDFNKVLRVIDQVNDHISQGTAIMIIPVDPRAFEAKELALLERNVEKLSSKAKPAK